MRSDFMYFCHYIQSIVQADLFYLRKSAVVFCDYWQAEVFLVYHLQYFKNCAQR